jgi:hypothetical protein
MKYYLWRRLKAAAQAFGPGSRPTRPGGLRGLPTRCQRAVRQFREFQLPMLEQLSTLCYAAQVLRDLDVPSVADDGSSHWTKTQEAMQVSLGRRMTDEEVTCLSLTRRYGPMPALSEDIRAHVCAYLFQTEQANYGLACGGSIGWKSLDERLFCLMCE